MCHSKSILSYTGNPSNKHAIGRTINQYSSLANIHRIRVHNLRHSHASLLIQMGGNPLVIKEQLKHEDIETTLGAYGHLYSHSNFKVANKLNNLISFKTAQYDCDSPKKNQFNSNTRIKNAMKVK